MSRHAFLLRIVALMLFVFCPVSVHADEKSDAKIEALITHVQGMKDATFVRNGTEYQAKDAAKFLRGKWKSKKREIHTPEDFITKVATKSSTTGKVYLIRMKGAKEVPCAVYLHGRLAKL